VTSLLTTTDIAELLKVGHRHVRETLVKRPDFPRPSINLSQKMRRWDQAKVQAWVDAQAKKNAA
jgi:predicted DNA-binding transcriptional regulator AlpA